MSNPRLPAAEEYVALGRALRELRRSAGLTQVQAAEIVGIRSTFVSLIERGERGVRWHTLQAMLRAYGADMRQLADALDSQSQSPAPANRSRTRAVVPESPGRADRQ